MSVKEDCEIVGVCYENIENVTIREVIQAYRKKALKVHPDKVDEDNKEKAKNEFQVLNNSYERLLKYMVEKVKENRENAEDKEEESEESEEEKFTEENFKNFNFPKENDGSFTVKIQHSQADEWQENLEKRYGEPTVHKTSKGTVKDTFWQFKYSVEDRETVITLHIYNKPKNKNPSKLLIQSGNQSLVCIYVFSELPLIYKNILTIDAVTEERKKAANLVECGQCKVSATLTGMKMHLKKVHNTNTKSKKTSQSFLSQSLENRMVEFKCDKCEYKTNNRTILMQHTDVHLFQLELRSQNDEQIGNVSNHMKSVHTNHDSIEGPEIIDIECMDKSEEEEDFDGLSQVKERDCPTPVPESLFICGECTNGFENQSDVEIHMRKHHVEITNDERIRYLEAQLIKS